MSGLQWKQFDSRQNGDSDPPDAVLQTRPYVMLDHEHFEERWVELGKHFHELFNSQTSVALSPIGAFGYYSRLRIVDILGLTNDSTLAVPPSLELVDVKGHHKTNVEWVLDREPDIIIFGNGVGGQFVQINPWERELFASPVIHERYQRVRMPVPEGESLDFWISKKTPLPDCAQVVLR